MYNLYDAYDKSIRVEQLHFPARLLPIVIILEQTILGTSQLTDSHHNKGGRSALHKNSNFAVQQSTF